MERQIVVALAPLVENVQEHDPIASVFRPYRKIIVAVRALDNATLDLMRRDIKRRIIKCRIRTVIYLCVAT